ncbi:MAG: hypothetical protein IH934_04180 [Nanoarchaeota archaeon]|nr:hypothetical protein [Nanoarchaeota archaeon]
MPFGISRGRRNKDLEEIYNVLTQLLDELDKEWDDIEVEHKDEIKAQKLVQLLRSINIEEIRQSIKNIQRHYGALNTKEHPFRPDAIQWFITFPEELNHLQRVVSQFLWYYEPNKLHLIEGRLKSERNSLEGATMALRDKKFRFNKNAMKGELKEQLQGIWQDHSLFHTQDSIDILKGVSPKLDALVEQLREHNHSFRMLGKASSRLHEGNGVWEEYTLLLQLLMKLRHTWNNIIRDETFFRIIENKIVVTEKRFAGIYRKHFS